MILYVSGPMSGIDDFNFPTFAAAAAKLRNAGYEVIDPGEKGLIEGWEWFNYLRYDIGQLMYCDGIALLPGWEDSKGARLERHIAVELGIRAHTVEMWLLLKTMADEYGPNRDSETEGISA